MLGSFAIRRGAVPVRYGAARDRLFKAAWQSVYAPYVYAKAAVAT
jgi:hypothetical protein